MIKIVSIVLDTRPFLSTFVKKNGFLTLEKLKTHFKFAKKEGGKYKRDLSHTNLQLLQLVSHQAGVLANQLCYCYMNLFQHKTCLNLHIHTVCISWMTHWHFAQRWKKDFLETSIKH